MSTDLTKQNMLALAYTVDAADGVMGDGIAANVTAGKIANCVLSTVPQLDGQWTVVWGPRVYDFPIVSQGHSNNTMMVVQSVSDPDTYVVAIAGTDPTSWSDWLFEDFWVWDTFPWIYGLPGSGKAAISAGTAVGLVTLQNLTPVTGTPGAGLRLADFLSSAVEGKSGVKIYVTGHSLGGALAPAAACWLNDTKIVWGGEATTIYTYAFAGATPGNGAFASWMNRHFPGDQLVRVSNTLDLVPHAWNYDTMMEIPDLYPSPYNLPTALDDIVQKIATRLQPLDYQFVGQGAQIQPIDGVIHDVSPLPSSQLGRFLAQVLYQHVDAYPAQLGMPDLNTQIQSCKDKFLG